MERHGYVNLIIKLEDMKVIKNHENVNVIKEREDVKVIIGCPVLN